MQSYNKIIKSLVLMTLPALFLFLDGFRAEAATVYTYTYTGGPLTQIVGSDVQASADYLGHSIALSFNLPFTLPPNLVAGKGWIITIAVDFDVVPEDLVNPVKVIVIDGNGKKHQKTADLKGVLSFE